MTPSSRNNQLRQIKAAGRAFFLDESGAYSEDLERACYMRLTGTTHCRCMTDAQLRQVGDYLARGTGHKPERKVALRPSSSSDLVARLEAFRRRPPPAGWNYHPLDIRMVWSRATGSDTAIPFAHLDSKAQTRLYRALVAIYARADRGASTRPARGTRARRAANAPAQAHPPAAASLPF